MTYKQLKVKIQKKVRLNSSRYDEIIKEQINDQIAEFCRTKEWNYAKLSSIITLDGSNSYTISSILTNPCTVISIHKSDGKPVFKTSYEEYLELSDKTDRYATYGDTLYMQGDTGDFTVLYTSFGGSIAPDRYPLSANDDEIPITKYYADIIALMVAIFMLEDVGDTNTIQLEQRSLDTKLSTLYKQENRNKNLGIRANIERNNLRNPY